MSYDSLLINKQNNANDERHNNQIAHMFHFHTYYFFSFFDVTNHTREWMRKDWDLCVVVYKIIKPFKNKYCFVLDDNNKAHYS